MCLAEQITCSTAEGSEMYVDAHGMLPFVALDLKRHWNIQRNFSKKEKKEKKT